MTATPLAPDALIAMICSGAGATGNETGRTFVVDLDRHDGGEAPAVHAGFSGVVIGTTAHAEPLSHPAVQLCDVVAHPDDPVIDAITSTVTAHPLASAALAVLLRGSELRSLDDGLVAESATYSSLQSGPEFAAWLAARSPRQRPAEGDPVLLDRAGAVLMITLNRPTVRNALNVAMREALIDACDVVAADPSIMEVHLRGAGATFCSGGDLDEFGTFTDPAAAHLVRLERSVARAIATVADRVVAHMHGPCVGSGIELPAFCARVVAHPDTTFSLPEVSLGLVPGAGGTVSLPRRIGRHRTALLGLCGHPIDAPTALRWGLVDALDADGT